uniref:Adenosine receptor A1-like n=1 Tax=Geotrypetes seraphini TaxID=260995 RepID=A0A6P8S4K5_GEOSA|nr:adenosine receptor A1-like [Geotrypetes seraphini]
MDNPSNSSCFQDLNGSCPSPSNAHLLSMSMPYFAIEGVTAFIAIIGNLFICTVILRDKKLRIINNYFLVSLAMADILVGAVGVPCAVLTNIGIPKSNRYLCVLMLCSLIVCTLASVFGLLAIAVERYISIVKPFHYDSLMTPKNSLLIILACWTLAILSGLVPLMGWHKPFPLSGECLFEDLIANTYMVYFIFLGCMLVPLSIMFFLYGRIFMEVKHQIRRIAKWEVDISREKKRQMIIRKEVQTATSLFIVLFCFAFCWLPINILNLIFFFWPSYQIPSQVTLTAVIFSHANSAFNPVLYVFRMRFFWEAFQSVFSCLYFPTTISRFSNSNLTPSQEISDQRLEIRTMSLPGK